MKIEFSNEVLTIKDGTYNATIDMIQDYDEGNKIIMKLRLEDGTIFVKFYRIEEFSRYPWADVFRTLESDDTDDLIDKEVEITVANRKSEKTGTMFCNIKKVKLV